MHIINYYIHKFSQESLYHRFSNTFLRDIQPPWEEIPARLSSVHLEDRKNRHSWVWNRINFYWKPNTFLFTKPYFESPNSGVIEYKIYKFIISMAYSTMLWSRLWLHTAAHGAPCIWARAGWAKFQMKILVLIYILYLWCYGTSTSRYRAGSTGFRWQIPEVHMWHKKPRHGKDGPQCRSNKHGRRLYLVYHGLYLPTSR